MEQTGQACSTVTMRLVFFTDLQHRVHVQRTQGAQIDHFGLDALCGQLLGRFQRHGRRVIE